MDRVTFIAENDSTLSWMWDEKAPDLTDDQARTIAIVQLGRSIDRLAEALERHCEIKETD